MALVGLAMTWSAATRGVMRFKDDYFLFKSVFIYKNNHIKLFLKKNYTKIYFN